MTVRARYRVFLSLMIFSATAACADESENGDVTSVNQGQRIFTAGHSFHMFVPQLLSELAKSANIQNHVQVGRQSIGGSYVYQHFNRADEGNAAKQALKTGKVDILTLSPIYLPDDGIENFARFGLEFNPDIRITIQEFWLPFDVYDKNYKKKRPTPLDRNARTVEQIRTEHGKYFKSMNDHVRDLNEKLGKQVLFVVPAGQASILSRERIIAGDAPGLAEQNDLFRDAIGHPTPPLQVLTAYCHFAVIYRRSPVGLPTPVVLTNAKYADDLSRLLQRLAWQAVCEHRQSGVHSQ